MSKVIFKKSSYSYDTLKPTVIELLNDLGKDIIKKNTRVLIKPNLLTAAQPDKAILTHPLVVKAVAEYVIDKGGSVQISDSPATGAFEKILKEGGYISAFDGLDVNFKKFTSSVKVDIGKPFGYIDIARDAIEADVVINLAKLKTHTQMLLTLGVKNMFGCIIGLKKPEWHLKAGVNREMFATLIVQIYNAVKPSITIIDGILAMEGQGPGKAGVPRYLGVIAGSCDAISLDHAICKMLKLDANTLLTNKAAEKIGLTNNPVDILGDFYKVSNFQFPATGSLSFGPKQLQKLMRKYMIHKPTADHDKCEMCGICVEYCPAKAITSDIKSISFNYEKCIRCFCCLEVCPHGALKVKQTVIGKLINKLPSFISI